MKVFVVSLSSSNSASIYSVIDGIYLHESACLERVDQLCKTSSPNLNVTYSEFSVSTGEHLVFPPNFVSERLSEVS